MPHIVECLELAVELLQVVNATEVLELDCLSGARDTAGAEVKCR